MWVSESIVSKNKGVSTNFRFVIIIFHMKKLIGKKHIILDFDRTIATLIMDWYHWIDEMEKVVKEHDPSINDFSYLKMNNYYDRFGNEFKDLTDRMNADLEESHTSRIEPNKALISFIKSTNTPNLYVWSSNSRHTVKKHLHDLGILDRFKKIIGREDVSHIKPIPAGWRHFDAQNDDLKEYVFIGDSDADRGAAEAIGIDFVHVDELE